MEKIYIDKAKQAVKFKFKNLIYPQRVEKFNAVIDQINGFDFYLAEYTYALTIASIMNKSDNGLGRAIDFARENMHHCNILNVNAIVLNYVKNGPKYIRQFYNNDVPAEILKTVVKIEKENKKFEKELAKKEKTLF